ncbi:MFS monocarboxylate transporter [Colletotrichum chrysophilum]|uniref:MFS monocarboxylate transporter n=1 Tax=Colletotrichum chrysophilum TaxID=1836956 RepID=A0AAD9A8D5_9PEZI|nr:MFS monocarboxylate transporter [Colletotrichum chrysophilum]
MRKQSRHSPKGVKSKGTQAQNQTRSEALTSDPELTDDSLEEVYPEGGTAAYLVVFGSFCAIMGGLGLMNSIGIYQSWFSTHQLHDVDEGKLAWIFGLFNFMVFFCGIQIGPVFDVHGPTWLMAASIVLYMTVFASIGFCKEYWHFLVVIGLVAGSATSIIFVVPVATVGQYFQVKRGAATGLAMAGGSVGGVMFPLMFDSLSEKIGFAWTTRSMGLITLVLLMVGCLLVRPRKSFRDTLPLNRSILPDFHILLQHNVFLMTIGVFFIEWGFFIGLEYVASYSLANGIGKRLSFLMIVFLNAGSVPGRWLPGLIADKFGRMNTMIATNLLCVIAILAIWLPANGNAAAVITFCVVFGFASGSNISLVPVCVGEYCSTQDYGRYYSTVYTVVSLGALTGVPIAGAILERSHGSYFGLIVFSGVSYVAGTACFVGLGVLYR